MRKLLTVAALLVGSTIALVQPPAALAYDHNDWRRSSDYDKRYRKQLREQQREAERRRREAYRYQRRNGYNPYYGNGNYRYDPYNNGNYRYNQQNRGYYDRFGTWHPYR